VIDVLYVLGTVGFFALMLVYVRACEHLGHGTVAEAERAEASKP
jgi:hypothetical protein